MSSYKMFEGKKASFADLKKAEDAGLHNSNMLNLVSSVTAIERELEELEHRKAFLTELKKETEEYAENGDILNTDNIKKLFEKRTNYNYRNPRW